MIHSKNLAPTKLKKMKKSALKKLSIDPAVRVVLHARICKKKGRNLSLSFEGENNPKDALKKAKERVALGLADWMNYDALAAAEKATGSSYKTTGLTQNLGLFGHMHKVQMQKNLANLLDDTTFSNKVDNYLRIAREEGFEKVLQLPFEGKIAYDDRVTKENLFVLFHRRYGILLKFDTYRGDSVNGGTFYYNWKPGQFEWKLISSATSSTYGETESGALVGSHDCREALRLNLARLKKYGKFVTKWEKRPFLWLLHYMDTKEEGYDYKAINEERIALLPEYVRQAITPAKEAMAA